MNTRARVTALPAFLLAGLAGTMRLPVVVAAQGAPSLDGLGLPVIDIHATPTDYEGVPAELEAGRYLVNLTIEEGIQEANATFVLAPPEHLEAAMAFPEIPEGMATPADGSLPAWVDATSMAGGPMASPAQRGQAVLDLTAGEWFVREGDPAVPRARVLFTVTGELPADLTEPEADIDVTFSEYAFAIEGTLTAGEHVVRIENAGVEHHYIEIYRGPDGMTNDHLALALGAMANPAASPPAIPFDMQADLSRVFYTSDHSAGVVSWQAMSLEPGTYAGFCWFPDHHNVPHVFLGMHTVFTVS